MAHDVDGRAALEAKVAALIDEKPWMRADLLERQIALIANENSSYKAKSAKLIGVADQFVEAVAPYAACRRGCDQCCHMSTPIFQHEAQRLAAASGRKISVVPYRPHKEVLDKGLKFYGSPCPFLDQGQCSVYEVRPMICRVHHSLNSNSSECDTSVPLQQKTGVGMYNPDFLELPYMELTVRRNPAEPWGYLQEFFPL
ncbi:hypothetical protein BJN45_03025 [Azonexus hydrophilus]|uniref:Zinc/iron-chelating domain-containing protein n=1 Tax=Azonexus hydrophilus TaxID=418702 RepID=A0A1R1IDC5_9RHOO|nr:YkgJ family cysteine cluster protein [Azonexus hydrophilus]OMG56602.1 hypothetical protein BJN45_03025 [Azonexus hydrophilus]